MTLKGLAYTKTTWAYEERPVASSKLNTWDDRIESVLSLLCRLISQQWGGRDGIVREDDASLCVEATTPLGLSVQVHPGYAFIDASPYHLAQSTMSTDVSAPLSFDRIDLVQASLETWNVSIKTGLEAPSPSAPETDADCLPLAQLYLRPGMSCIKNADDGSHGYIIDVRPFL